MYFYYFLVTINVFSNYLPKIERIICERFDIARDDRRHFAHLALQKKSLSKMLKIVNLYT